MDPRPPAGERGPQAHPPQPCRQSLRPAQSRQRCQREWQARRGCRLQQGGKRLLPAAGRAAVPVSRPSKATGLMNRQGFEAATTGSATLPALRKRTSTTIGSRSVTSSTSGSGTRAALTSSLFVQPWSRSDWPHQLSRMAQIRCTTAEFGAAVAKFAVVSTLQESVHLAGSVLIISSGALQKHFLRHCSSQFEWPACCALTGCRHG